MLATRKTRADVGVDRSGCWGVGCAGLAVIDVREAQRAIAEDWTAAYVLYFGDNYHLFGLK